MYYKNDYRMYSQTKQDAVNKFSFDIVFTNVR